MQTAIKSIITHGSGGAVVDAECHFSSSLPAIVIVGLGTKIVDEAKERIRAAITSAGIRVPRKRIIINLAPADIPKDSTALDLAIALAILARAGLVRRVPPPNAAVIGELGLTGVIRPVRGIIGKLLVGKQGGIETFFIPRANLAQALLVPHITLVPLESLAELHAGLNGQGELEFRQTGKGVLEAALEPLDPTGQCLDDVTGQQRAKRALVIAAAGGHNLLLNGPPGTGKSMLAALLPSLLPVPGVEEMLEITHMHSLVGTNYERLITARPLRAPHHSVSVAAMIGSGTGLRPGEVSLGHLGVLFLDELPEFGRSTLEALRGPLENRAITLTRARDSAIFPADFLLVATANPCPCGFYGTEKDCQCPPDALRRYRRKLSGPLMDRFDLYTDTEPVAHERLLFNATGRQEHRRAVELIQQARARQATRHTLNAHMSGAQLKRFARPTPEAHALLDQAAPRLGLSARGYLRAVRTARTIADLAGAADIRLEDMSEALQYRPRQG